MFVESFIKCKRFLHITDKIVPKQHVYVRNYYLSRIADDIIQTKPLELQIKLFFIVNL